MPKLPLPVLQQMPVFGALSEAALGFLLQLAREIEVPAGGYFFREGDAASSMFVLESGRVSVLRRLGEREAVLNTLAAGDCFGEMALLDLQPRSAAVRADADCGALELTAADLLRLFEHDAESFALVQMNIGREVCRRLRQTDEALFRAWQGERPADWAAFAATPFRSG